MLAWRRAGFSVHNEVRGAAEDAEGRSKLAGYMLRAPMSLKKMTYDVATGSVIYRSKMHASLKRNFQVMSGAAWLELLCRHIPDRYQHLVRYVGWYANHSRGERAKKTSPHACAALTCDPSVEPATGLAARAKPPGHGSFARSTRPIRWSARSAKGPMRVIALIEDPQVIRRILEHSRQWAPQASERSPLLDGAFSDDHAPTNRG